MNPENGIQLILDAADRTGQAAVRIRSALASSLAMSPALFPALFQDMPAGREADESPVAVQEVELDAETKRSCSDAAALLKRAKVAMALTGAGISVPSGIPDFRSPGGLWSKYDPEEVASVRALRHNPLAVWRFLLEAARMFAKASPNPAHLALAELERAGRLGAVVTQNIDGLHQAAGSVNVVEFHGSAHSYHCTVCRIPVDPGRVAEMSDEDLPVVCPSCAALVRPDVVFFGEGIPRAAMSEADHWAGCADVALIVGTSGEVAPANTLPWRVKSRGGHVVEINIGPTAYEGLADVRIDAPAEVVLPFISRLVLA